MSEHSKGPWNRFGNLIMGSGGGGCVVGELRSALPGYEANARLIAASPDLLEACKGIEPLLDSLCDWDDGCLYVCGTARPELAEPLRLFRAAISKATGKDANE